MITPQLHRQAVPLDKDKHRQTSVSFPYEDWSHLASTNSLFVTAAECLTAAADYPIVFVKAGQDEQGNVDFAPIAVLGLSQGENLFLEGSRWRGSQFPALMATYPFCIARAGNDQLAVCVDAAASNLHTDGQGRRLFDDAGNVTEFTGEVQRELERLEAQIATTRQVTRRLVALDLLRERRFDATLPDGRQITVDGFFTVDEERVRALPDAAVLELHRDGVLTLIDAHWVSMAQMRRLLQWRIEREAAAKTAG